VLDDKLTYLAIEKLRRIERALDETTEIPGDVLEFGVALGGSAIVLAHLMGESRSFVGFDVFGMIPPPASEKDDAKSKERYNVIRRGESRGIGGGEYYGYKQDLLSEVQNAFQRHAIMVDGDRVKLIKGLFEESWPSANVGSISMAHLDCDWFDPVRFCLDAIADKMSSGGIIVIDDYHDYGGCRTAVQEFLQGRNDFAFEDGLNPFLRKS
jgi:asparagine synthase (glutamine-hydrolysing)